MLVLSRKLDEVVFIGEHIEVQVVSFGGGKYHVELGIVCPQELPIRHAEWPETKPSLFCTGSQIRIRRRIGEVILLGSDTRITIVDYVRGKSRIGFAAPRDVPIYREEVLERTQSAPPKERHKT